MVDVDQRIPARSKPERAIGNVNVNKTRRITPRIRAFAAGKERTPEYRGSRS